MAENENPAYEEYKEHNIYFLRLSNALWAASVVRLNTSKGDNRTSPGRVVDGIGGEFGSRDQAIRAAKQFIDKEVERLQL